MRIGQVLLPLSLAICAALLVADPTRAQLTVCDTCGGCESAAACQDKAPGSSCGPGRVCVDLNVDDCALNKRCCGCRDGGATIFQFDPPIQIPDGDPGGIFIPIELQEACPVEDVDVVLFIDHPRVSDLVVNIQHFGVNVQLIDRPGFPQQGGCNAQTSCSQPIFLSDGGVFPIDCPAPCNQCFPGGQVASGVYIPTQPLAAFDGLTLGAPWELTVVDAQQGVQGQVCAVGLIGACEGAASVDDADETPVPPAVWLDARPNPFNPSTTLHMELLNGGLVQLDVVSPHGRLVDRLVDERLAAGAHQFDWDGRDADGRTVTSGAYFAVVRTEGAAEVRKLLLLK